MVILCDKEVTILIGPTLTMNLKVDWFPILTMGRHRLIHTGRAGRWARLTSKSHKIQMWSSSSEG